MNKTTCKYVITYENSDHTFTTRTTTYETIVEAIAYANRVGIPSGIETMRIEISEATDENE